MKTLFEKSGIGKRGSSLPQLDVPHGEIPDEFLRETAFALPELSEPELVSHYTELSRNTFGVDNGFYPLGSCTMKYNPKINDECASLPSFRDLHPLSTSSYSQGALELYWNLERLLCELTGFARFSLQPAAGAQAEFTALLMAKAWFESRGEEGRRTVLIPDVAHGTNPASVKLVGWRAREIRTVNGVLTPEIVGEALDDTVAAIMVTNPNTLGIFERHIVEINRMVHEAGGLAYLDGANFNAVIGRYLPAEQGFDLMHLNLHKTFSTPHGGGGPGAGALGLAEFLTPFMPLPTVEQNGRRFMMDFARPQSVGKLSAFWGNYLVLLRAYIYVLTLGRDVHEVSEAAVANAYYLKERICPPYELAYESPFMHEFVVSCRALSQRTGVKAIHICKRLMDFGFHPPTMYFPKPPVVEEGLMIEPTETVSRETLERFAEALLRIFRECEENPELVKFAPHTTHVGRVDETRAARDMKLRISLS